MIDIKGLREALKMSQKEMCEALDMPQPLLSAVENRKKPLPKSVYEKLYNLYGDVVLKYKLPDVVIEVKKEPHTPDIVEEPKTKYETPPNEFISYLREKDAKLEEKEGEIRRLIRQVATLEAKLEVAKKGGYCLKEKESDAGCAGVGSVL